MKTVCELDSNKFSKKEKDLKVFFSDEKLFDVDGIYNSQNKRVWTVDRADADKKVGIK